MMCPLYAKLARICMATGRVSLADYYIVSGTLAVISQGDASFRAAIFHIKKPFEDCGLPGPAPEKNGSLVYRLPSLPLGHVLDTAEASRLAMEAAALLDAGGSLDQARQLFQRASELDADVSVVRQVQHRLLLASPDSSFRELSDIAHENSLRRQELRDWLARIAHMLNRPEWSDYWDLLRSRQHEYEKEYADLLFLQFRTTLRLYPTIAGNQEDAEFLQLVDLAVRAKQDPDRYQKKFEDAVVEYPGLGSIVRLILSYLKWKIRGQAPSRLSPEDVFRTVSRVVIKYLLENIVWERFDSPRALREYVEHACRVQCRIECIAEQYGLPSADVALAFRKWAFERKFRGANQRDALTVELRSGLGLRRPEDEERYQKMLDVEAFLKAKLVPLDDPDEMNPDALEGFASGFKKNGKPMFLPDNSEKALRQVLSDRTDRRVLGLVEPWARLKRQLREDGQELSEEQMQTEIGATPEEYVQLKNFIKDLIEIIGDESMHPEDLI